MAEPTDDINNISEAFKSLTLHQSNGYIVTALAYHVTKPGGKATIRKENLLKARATGYYQKYDGPLKTQSGAPAGVFFCITPTSTTGELPSTTVYPNFCRGEQHMDRLKMQLTILLDIKRYSFFHSTTTSNVATSKNYKQTLVVSCLTDSTQYRFCKDHFIEFDPSDCHDGDPLWFHDNLWLCQKIPIFTNICILHSVNLDVGTTWDTVWKIKNKRRQTK